MVAKLKEYIAVDSDFGKKIGFTSDFFKKDSYMFLDNNIITIPLIEARRVHQGSFSKVYHNLRKLGLTIRITEPSKMFMEILIHYGFSGAYESRGEGITEMMEVWTKKVSEDEVSQERETLGGMKQP